MRKEKNKGLIKRDQSIGQRIALLGLEAIPVDPASFIEGGASPWGANELWDLFEPRIFSNGMTLAPVERRGYRFVPTVTLGAWEVSAASQVRPEELVSGTAEEPLDIAGMRPIDATSQDIECEIPGAAQVSHRSTVEWVGAGVVNTDSEIIVCRMSDDEGRLGLVQTIATYAIENMAEIPSFIPKSISF